MKLERNNHHLIVIDGPNKCGKGTQVERIADWLRTQNRPAETIREPGGTVIGEKIRSILLDDDERPAETDVLLFNAARAATVSKIGKLLIDNDVVADRSYISTMAFQVHGDGMHEESTREICRFALGGNYRPTAVFILDIPYETYIERKSADEEKDYFERERLHFDRVRQGFAIEAQRVGAYVIDATRSKDEVTNGITALLERHL